MAPRLNYITELGRARCHQIAQQKRLSNCEVDNFTGCWLFNGSTNNDGYRQVEFLRSPFWFATLANTSELCKVFTKRNADLQRTGRAAQTAFLLHVISYIAANGAHRTDRHISHLCDIRNCFNPDHLVSESPQLNNDRKGCAGPIYCSVHGHLIVDLCSHSPNCVRGPRDDVECCLAIKESDPVGWYSSQSTTRSSQAEEGSKAEEIRVGSSQEYEGADWLDEALAQGII